MCAEIMSSSPEHSELGVCPLTSRVAIEEILAAPKGEMRTHGATPLDRVATLAQQLELRLDLQELTYRNIPDGAPFAINVYIHDIFTRRFNRRGEANEDNFVTSLHHSDYGELLEPAVVAMVDRARHGLASPAELLLVREQLGTRSIELACLTHPYGTNIDVLLDDMRFAIEYAVMLYEGEYFHAPETIYCVKEAVDEFSDMPDFTNGVLMTRKRTMGKLSDGTVIKERSSFVLRTDEASGFDQSILKRLQAELAQDRTLDWKKWLVEEGYVDMLAADLLASDDYTRAIPVSTTAYAFNPETTRQVYSAIAQAHTELIEEYRQQRPEMYDILYGEHYKECRAEHLAEQVRLKVHKNRTMQIELLDEEAIRVINSSGSYTKL